MTGPSGVWTIVTWLVGPRHVEARAEEVPASPIPATREEERDERFSSSCVSLLQSVEPTDVRVASALASRRSGYRYSVRSITVMVTPITT